MTHMLGFDYDLDEIVQLGGRALSLRRALREMPNPVPLSVALFRETGTSPTIFGPSAIEALLVRHRSELKEGKPPARSEARRR
jgi:hypothetical protein